MGYYECINCTTSNDTVKYKQTLSAERRNRVIHLDFRSAQPIYEQIVTQYKYLLLQGYLKKGDSIPSVRKLAMQLEITPGTVAKAYREMEQQGLIETVRGKGAFIAGVPENAPNEGVIVKVKEELKTQCMELIYQGFGKEDIVSLVEEIYDMLQGGKQDD